VPDKSELADIWLTMDFKMNYEPILRMKPGPKLENKRLMLLDVCNRITKENPLANFFLGMISSRMFDEESAQYRKQMAREYLARSEYWRSRFKAFGL